MLGVIDSAQKIVTDGLVFNIDSAQLRSYPGTGTAWDDLSGNNFNVTLNGPTFNSANGGVIVFDGINDLATYSERLFSGDFTISFWEQINGGIISNNQITLGNTNGNPGINHFNGYIRMWTGSSDTVVATLPTAVNTWYNYTYTRTGTTYRFYINGVLNNTNTAGVFNFRSNTLSPGPSGFFNGRIPIVHMYNRGLSDAEVLQNYSALRSRFGLTTTGFVSPIAPVPNYTGPIAIDTTGLQIYYDASIPYSYTDPSNAWYNLAQNQYHAYLYLTGYDSNNGGSITIPGNSNAVDIIGTNSTTLGITTVGTYSGWIYRTTTGIGFVIADYDGLRGMTLRINNNTSADFFVYPGNYRITSSFSFSPNVWYNLTGVLDGSNMYLYINGVQTGTRSLPSGVGNGNSFRIGVPGNTPFGAAERVSNVQVYNRALSAAEVLSNFNALKSRFGY